MQQRNPESRLIEIFGSEKVFSDPQTISFYASSMTGSRCEPSVVVFPESEEDVISLVKIAAELQLKLFPISRGKNMGYGDAHGTAHGQVIVDLRRMKSILNVDDQLCFATIQPGVSQGQFYSYIKERNLQVQLDVTGAGLDASVVGNLLERGFGHTDYGDRFGQLISLRVVMADGKVLHTGFGAYKDADALHSYRYGVGPVLDGLFTQSNFGIITEVTIGLMPKPETTYTFAGSIRSVDQLSSLVNVIREAKLKGILSSAVHIANRSRTVGKTDNKLIGSWNVSGCISGPKSLVRKKAGLLRSVFKKHIKGGYLLIFLTPLRMKWMKFVNDNIFKISVFRPLFEVFQQQNGIPTDDPLKTLLDDESAESASVSIAKYPYCFGWINAVISANGESVNRAVCLLDDLFQKWNYELRITMTAVNPRTLILISNITYERSEEAIKKAEDFMKVCHAELNKAGFLPYRSGSGTFSSLPQPDTATADVLKKIKNALDPGGMFAPGKYGIPE